MDPSILVSTAGKALVEGTIRKMMKKSENIDETLGEDFKILGREMRVECPQSIQNYSVTFETKVSGLHLLPKKKRSLILERLGELPLDLLCHFKAFLMRYPM